MDFAGKLDLRYSRTPVTRKMAVIPSASVTSTASPGRRDPRRKKTAGPRLLSTWPSMTDAPIWPGVAEYLYHAARSALVSGGTCIEPSAFTPRRRSLELTPIAGISTDTGSERESHGPRPAGPRTPAVARDGWGACCWALTARPTAVAPIARSRTPATPARRARRLSAIEGGEATPSWGQETTTRNPAIRRHCTSPNPSAPPPAFPMAFYSRSLIFRW